MSQVVECLLSKCKALSSNPNFTKKKKKSKNLFENLNLSPLSVSTLKLKSGILLSTDEKNNLHYHHQHSVF
jgi:hypothetical protein